MPPKKRAPIKVEPAEGVRGKVNFAARRTRLPAKKDGALDRIYRRHLFPLAAFLVAAAVNSVYLKWPFLEEVAPSLVLIGLLNGLLVSLALYLSPNLGKKEAWFADQPE